VPGAPALELIPLGGLGEFGMNMMLVACGDTAILVDAGVMFPEPDMLGVDLIIPDLRPLLQRYRIQALVLTHGHEDHIGAVPHVVGHFDGPIYGTKLTLAFLEPKLEEHGPEVRARLTEVSPRDRVTVGSFTIEFLRVTHSMPDCVAVAIHTPAGVVLHTGDFKIDQTPLDGQHVDFQRFAQLGAEGVLVMLGDSTNVDRKGVSGSERDVVDGFEEVFTSARGRIVIAMFSSSLYRMQILVDLADQFDRKVAFVGRGVIENSQIAMRLGYLRIPPGVQIRDSDLAGRAAGGAAADRDRRSPAREDRPGRRGGVLGEGDSGEREGDRAGDEPHREAGGRHHLRGDQARARVRTRQRGRAETDAVPRQAAVLRADTRGVPAARAARPDRQVRLPRDQAGAGRERGPHPYR
jgi:mRNA degradation ribonuclease J1/J2